jgi:hypothetical protein
MRLEFSGPPSHKRLPFSTQAPETRPGHLRTHRAGWERAPTCVIWAPGFAQPAHQRFLIVSPGRP